MARYFAGSQDALRLQAFTAEAIRTAGLTHGMVMYEEANPASGALDRAMGIAPTWTVWGYRKPVD